MLTAYDSRLRGSRECVIVYLGANQGNRVLELTGLPACHSLESGNPLLSMLATLDYGGKARTLLTTFPQFSDPWNPALAGIADGLSTT